MTTGDPICSMCGKYISLHTSDGTCLTRKTCPHCGIDLLWTWQETTVERKYELRCCTVDMVCIWRGRILLIKRGNEPFKDCWALPGGYVDKENVERAVTRELHEETTIVLAANEVPELIGVFSDYERDPRHTISILYHVDLSRRPDMPLVSGGDDASIACWFEMADLPVLAFDHKEMIEKYIYRR